MRKTGHWQDTIYLGGFWAPGSCSATRRRESSLVVPGDLLVTERVCGDALNVPLVWLRWRRMWHPGVPCHGGWDAWVWLCGAVETAVLSIQVYLATGGAPSVP